MAGKEEALRAHKEKKGKIEIFGSVPINTKEELSIFYTPGVAYVSEAIRDNKELVYEYTLKGRTVAIINDGTRVLGLGNIGPEAGLPVMEGKALLFKKFGGVDAVPISIAERDQDRLVRIIKSLEPGFGAINLEDIESPKCFDIQERLKAEMAIPVFHDDRYGVAAVTLAGLINALKLAGKRIEGVKIVINGAGAAGIGIAELLHHAGNNNMYILDTHGLLYRGRSENMNHIKEKISLLTNKEMIKGTLEEALLGADVFIGVSSPGAFRGEYVKLMAEKPIIFALANPVPEIDYHEAVNAGAFIAATGRSDRPNQVNNLLGFPGIMRGLLEVRAKSINEDMLLQAAKEIAKLVGKKLSKEMIIPDPLEKKTLWTLAANVAGAVGESAVKSDLARVHVSREEIKKRVIKSIKRYAKIEKYINKQK